MATAFPPHKDGMVFDEDTASEEGWLVFCHANRAPLATRVPRDRRIFVVNEPSPMSRYPASYVNQFGLIVSPFALPGCTSRWFPSHPGLPWLFGAVRSAQGLWEPTFTYPELANLPAPEKVEALSVVVSNKVFHAGHRKRLAFVGQLQSRLGDRLVVFGHGIRSVKDKAEAILPMAYHLALENTIEPSYWTEKLSDAYLGYAFPIYSGCSDVSRWFPPRSMLQIDIERPADAIGQIVDAVDGGLWRHRRAEVLEARRRVLETETVFDVVARAIHSAPSDASGLATPEVVQPITRKGVLERTRRELHRLYQQCRLRLGSGR
jgi:hypothetical protein